MKSFSEWRVNEEAKAFRDPAVQAVYHKVGDVVEALDQAVRDCEAALEQANNLYYAKDAVRHDDAGHYELFAEQISHLQEAIEKAHRQGSMSLAGMASKDI